MLRHVLLPALVCSMCAHISLVACEGQAAIMDNVQGLYKFDDGTGSTAADSSTPAIDGTLLNFPGDDSQWVSGMFGGALDFDGTDDEVNADVNVSETTYAVSFWINTSTAGRGLIEGNRSGGHDRHVYITGDGNVAARVFSNQTITSTTVDVADG